MDDNQEVWQSYWKNFADAFTHPLKANGLLSKFVTNTAVTGAYAEAWIKFIAKSMLRQFNISTGSVIQATDKNRGLRAIPQCDIIIWDSSAFPALFEQGDFAIVHHTSVRAIIEVKRSCTKVSTFQKQLEKLQERIRASPDLPTNVLGVVVSHSKPLFLERDLHYDWVRQRPPSRPPAMTRFFDTKSKDVDVIGVMAFIGFLATIGGHQLRL